MRAVFFVFVTLLAGCNSRGPYYGTVSSLDAQLYAVNIGTWYPDADEELKKQGEIAAVTQLKQRGVAFEVCVFDSFTPYQGGHIYLNFIAGSEQAVSRWRALPEEKRRQLYLRSIELGKFESRFANPQKSRSNT